MMAASPEEVMGSFARRVLLVALALAALAGSPAVAAERFGVVMLHGKQGLPRQLESYDAPLAVLGHLTERPEMCWSHQRIYDRPYLACLGEIDDAVGRLKARGATAFVIIGMSLGGNAALGYGARRHGLMGIVALAPAHAVELLALRPNIAASIERARILVSEGNGDAQAAFAENNTGVDFTVTTTPKIYLSFHGPDSPAVLPANASRLTAPLLYVAGTEDRTQRGPGYVFDHAPKNPLNRYVTVHSDHRGTPAAGREAVIEWLKELARR
jgi:pimeloyl-ACP methyl ester carboxylesterase